MKIPPLVVKFPETGSVARSLLSLQTLKRNGIIRVIDPVFFSKDAKGNAVITEAKEWGGKTGDAFSAFARTVSDTEGSPLMILRQLRKV